MDITRISRNARLFALPTFLLLLSLIILVLLPGDELVTEPFMAPLELVLKAGRLVFAVLALVSCAWIAVNGFRLARWEAGDRNGDCLNCGAAMSRLAGRYGRYRRCQFCGSKRSGW